MGIINRYGSIWALSSGSMATEGYAEQTMVASVYFFLLEVVVLYMRTYLSAYFILQVLI